MAYRKNGALGGDAHEDQTQKKIQNWKWVCHCAVVAFGSIYGISPILYGDPVLKAVGRTFPLPAKTVCPSPDRPALYRTASAYVQSLGAVFKISVQHALCHFYRDDPACGVGGYGGISACKT